MKKKILALFLAVLLLTPCVFAGWDLEIGTESLWGIGLKLDDVEATAGDKGVEVYVYIEANDGICAGAFELEFNDEVMTLAKAPELVDLAGFEVVGASDLTASPYYTSITSGSAVLGDGKLLKYTFDIDRSAPEETYEIKLLPTGEGGAQNIPLEFIDANREPVGVNVDFGSIKVSKPPYIPGDANGDGEVTNKDAARILQYVARWDVEIDMLAADANGDGEVTNKDAARILQYVAHWGVELG